MINFVIGDVMFAAAITDGVNISVNPTIIVLDASAASGTCSMLSNGKNGLPKIEKTSV